MSTFDPRKLAGYVIVSLLVGSLVFAYVRAIGPAVRRERQSACAALEPTAESALLGTFPRPAPDMAAQDYTGKLVSLSAYRGQVVLLNFWATWCPPCVAELPALEELQRTLAKEPFTVLTAVSETDWNKVRAFFPDGTNLSVLLDPPPGAASGEVGNVARGFGTERLPETYVIDKKGMIRFYFVARRDWSSGSAQRCLRSLIEE